MSQEHELIEGCRNGQLKSQEALYRCFYAFAMSVCIRYTANREDALEALNDSFMKVFDHIDRYDPEKPFKSWFRRILVNTCLDHSRSNRSYLAMTDFDHPVEEHSTEAEYEMAMTVEDILSLFGQLPEIGRIIFNLYEIEGYSHEEIAGMLDIAPGTSRSYLSRTKKRLESLYVQRLRHEIL